MLTREALSHSQRTLVVEDNAAEGGAIVEVLRKRVSPPITSDAAAAIDSLSANKYGCLIVDLGLPDMDGLELTRGAESDPRRALLRESSFTPAER